ncbi:MAG: chemotaxis protein CheW [Acidobacteriota bacterium]
MNGALLISVGSRRLSVPLAAVEAIVPWKAPLELPHGQSWLAGLLPRRGEAVPVLNPAETLGAAEESPEVLLLMRLHGRPLALPGREPRRWEGISPAEGGAGADPLDVEALYSACGLR